MRSIRDAVAQDGAALQVALALPANEARLEAQMLLQHVLQVPRAYLLAHPEQSLDEQQFLAYAALVQRRLRGEPVAYLLGEREFFGLNLKVTPATLIPRPETELLVELALQRMPPQRGLRVLDLGTGSGAIALAIAQARPDIEVVAVDASEAALRVARENAARLGIRNAGFLQSDWFSALDGRRFDLIVSNPPYVAAGDVHLGQGDVRFEPPTALASGADGLDDIRRIVGRAPDFLAPGAWLLLEHGYDQAAQVRELLAQNGYGNVFSARDLAGMERASGGSGRD
jgi:release factor glutamine methyltransferase